MLRIVTTYLIGLVFGLGIMISGMANPAKVLNFFDVAGTWDASLIFVMGGALVVTFIGYRLIFGKGPAKPVMADTFHVPQNRVIDTRLLGGSAIFGVGWGIAGFCPGGALPAVGTLKPEVLIFTAALIAGIFLAKALQNLSARRTAQSAS